MLLQKIALTIFLSFIFSLPAAAVAENQSTQDRTYTNIANLKIDDIVLAFTDKKLDKDKKKQALSFATSQVELRKIATSSIFKSKQDLLAIGRAGLQLALSGILLLTNGLVAEAVTHEKTIQAVLEVGKKNGLSEAEGKNVLPAVGNIMRLLFCSLAGYSCFRAIINIKNGISCQHAQAKLKRAQAIESYIRQVAAL